MRIPSATYRIQLNASFGFEEARRIVPYLSELGVSAVYASPIFKAREGSTHGYDVVDPNRIDPQIGTREEFEALVEDVRERGMTWLQDFVPNHMAYASGNHMLMDVFEKGSGSPFFNFFDVVWDHLRENLRGKLIAPFLGGPYGETLEKGEISLAYGESGFHIKYWGTVYPLRIESYARVIERRLDSLKERLGGEHTEYVRLLGILQVFKNLPEDMTGDGGRNAQIALGKELLWRASEESEEARALSEMAAFFPVYRTYFDRSSISHQDRRYVEEAIERAKAGSPELARELDFIEMVLRLNYPEPFSEEEKELWLSFVMRFQQFTSPLMAKGLEDTTFYIFNRLISLNEVGSDPSRFGIPVKDFHEWNRARGARHPHTLNATSTRDTKRGEDTRARINVLSEIPEEWAEQLEAWRERDRALAPVEYFLYQTLLGSFPFEEAELDGYAQRIKDYMIKAAREAKINTFWQDPNPDYEAALVSLVERKLDPSPGNGFLKSFKKFQRKIAHFGAFNSLSQVVIKITSPGVPDFYQGSELWRFSLVDPDNRRAVDYEKRERLLRDLAERERTDLAALLEEMLSAKEDGRVKLFTVRRALRARNEDREVYEAGDYIPLSVTGARAENVVAFARRSRSGSPARWAVTIAPRLLTSVVSAGELPLGGVWRETRVELPEGAPSVWRNAFTDEVTDRAGTVPVADALARFPVSLLTGE